MHRHSSTTHHQPFPGSLRVLQSLTTPGARRRCIDAAMNTRHLLKRTRRRISLRPSSRSNSRLRSDVLRRRPGHCYPIQVHANRCRLSRVHKQLRRIALRLKEKSPNRWPRPLSSSSIRQTVFHVQRAHRVEQRSLRLPGPEPGVGFVLLTLSCPILTYLKLSALPLCSLRLCGEILLTLLPQRRREHRGNAEKIQRSNTQPSDVLAALASKSPTN